MTFSHSSATDTNTLNNHLYAQLRREGTVVKDLLSQCATDTIALNSHLCAQLRC